MDRLSIVGSSVEDTEIVVKNCTSGPLGCGALQGVEIATASTEQILEHYLWLSAQLKILKKDKKLVDEVLKVRMLTSQQCINVRDMETCQRYNTKPFSLSVKTENKPMAVNFQSLFEGMSGYLQNHNSGSEEDIAQMAQAASAWIWQNRMRKPVSTLSQKKFKFGSP
jgi:hypothetical protein